MIKVLNLYSGIGGNRANWQDVKVTAVEYNADIAAVYRDIYPDDNVVVADAHEYLLNHYDEFDFIWSSPPCQTHSRAMCSTARSIRNIEVYPDMRLYQEIMFLQHYSSAHWVVENVIPYYKPLIPPSVSLDRHLFWSDFYIPQNNFPAPKLFVHDIKSCSTAYGFSLKKYNIKNKRQILRNLVNPQVGNYIFNFSLNNPLANVPAGFQASIF